MLRFASSCGVGIALFMALVFIALRIGGMISWPWFWVLCPIWLGAVLFILGLAIFALFVIAKSIFGGQR